jgi:hypothetical protein
MRKTEREALGYDKKRTFAPHWPYYWQCVYPGYQNAYYPETVKQTLNGILQMMQFLFNIYL